MKQNIDIDEVKRLYYDEKLSVSAVAQELDVPINSVQKAMQQHGLKRRSRKEARVLRDPPVMSQIDIDEIKRLYYDEKLSVSAVAQRVEIPKCRVQKAMQQHGLRRRSRKEAQGLRVPTVMSQIDVNEIKRLYYDEKLSVSAVAQRMGVPINRVRKAMQQHGLKRRSRKEAQGLSCLLYTSPSPRDRQKSRMPSSA